MTVYFLEDLKKNLKENQRPNRNNEKILFNIENKTEKNRAKLRKFIELLEESADNFYLFNELNRRAKHGGNYPRPRQGTRRK